MVAEQQQSWVTRLYQRVRRSITFTGGPGAAPAAASPLVVRALDNLYAPPSSAGGARAHEDWRDLLYQGRRVVVSWDGGDEHGTMLAEGEVRLTFDETVWIWLDRTLPDEGRPVIQQAMQLLTPTDDAMRIIPCRLVEGGRGGSLQVEVSGRISRVQRRDDVRARVDLPPISAVRVDADGRPLGLLGLQLIDLSAGGIRALCGEPLSNGDRLRLVLRLDDDTPITPTVDVLVGGFGIQGQFAPMPERDRRRIVQYVYRQDLAARRRQRPTDQAADGLE